MWLQLLSLECKAVGGDPGNEEKDIQEALVGSMHS